MGRLRISLGIQRYVFERVGWELSAWVCVIVRKMFTCDICFSLNCMYLISCNALYILVCVCLRWRGVGTHAGFQNIW